MKRDRWAEMQAYVDRESVEQYLARDCPLCSADGLCVFHQGWVAGWLHTVNAPPLD